MSILAPTLGVATAIVDEFRLLIARRRTCAFDAAREAHLVSAYAEAAAQVSLACDSLVHEAKRLLDVLEDGGSFPIAARGESRMRLVLMARSGVTAAQRLLALAGGQILLKSSRLERLFRDPHAMSSHLLLQPEPVAQAFGRLELGLEQLADVRFRSLQADAISHVGEHPGQRRGRGWDVRLGGDRCQRGQHRLAPWRQIVGRRLAPGTVAHVLNAPVLARRETAVGRRANGQ
jgi:hypothetical protein